MKPFLLFAYNDRYPTGGWNDFVGGFDTLEEARERTKTLRSNCWHIVDANTLTEIESN